MDTKSLFGFVGDIPRLGHFKDRPSLADFATHWTFNIDLPLNFERHTGGQSTHSYESCFGKIHVTDLVRQNNSAESGPKYASEVIIRGILTYNHVKEFPGIEPFHKQDFITETCRVVILMGDKGASCLCLESRYDAYCTKYQIE